MLEWIGQQVVAMHFDGKTIRKLELAAEEAIVNIVNHAYRGGEGTIEIGVKVVLGSHVEISLKDRGPPFDPLQEERKIDPDLPLEEREEGGLGILMIRHYMDEVRYAREGGHNVLTLVKRRVPHQQVVS